MRRALLLLLAPVLVLLPLVPVLVLLLDGGPAAVAAVAPAAAAPADTVRFFLAGRVQDPAIVLVATGAITGVGTLSATSVDYHPADRTYRETDVAALGPGTLTLSVDGTFDTWPFDLDPATCTAHGSLSGKWTITAATGDFAGSAGGGTFSGRYVTHAAKGAAGCDTTALQGFVVGSMVGAVRR